MTIYAIIGATGAYEDYHTWISKCFTDKQLATSYVCECTTFASTIDPNDYHTIEINSYLSPDPHFNMDYTGTNYSLEEHELVTDKFMETLLTLKD